MGLFDFNSKRSTMKGIKINDVTWAMCNVYKPGTFAAKPEDLGMFYQWNRKTGWSATDPMINSNGGTTWDDSEPIGIIWKKANDPSPVGWRIPTLEEIQSLLNTNRVSNEWISVNNVFGRKFTDKASGNSLFLPAAYDRFGSSGQLNNFLCEIGSYWSSTPKYEGIAYELTFSAFIIDYATLWTASGLSLRCVLE